MQNSSNSGTRRSLLLCLFVLGLVTAFVVLPSRFVSEAGQAGEGSIPQTVSHEEGLEWYDIRMAKGSEAADALTRFRQAAGKDASFVADERQGFADAEVSLRTSLPTLKVDYNQDLLIPEVIGLDVNIGNGGFLTGPSSAKRSDILRNFLKQNNELVGMTDSQLDNLDVQADYSNPAGNMSFVVLEQNINGIPVSRGEVKAGFSKSGQMVRVINNLAPGLEYGSLSTDFGDAVDAVRNASSHIDHEVRASDIALDAKRSTNLKVTFGTEFYATTAEKLYFPTEVGIARPAWRVTIWKDVPAYEVTVDAETGALLRRENLVKDQTQPVTYNVWTNATSPLKSMDNPAPLTPGPVDPAPGTQGVLQARTSVSFIGNEAPNGFNNNGWINDGQNTTSGNNVNAGLDRGNPNGVDAPTTGSGMRIFNFAANPPPGNPGPGDDPLPAGEAISPCPAAPNATINPSQHAAVVQMFFVSNQLHDYMYRHGFTEPARNFQVDNFGRGGTGGDPVQAEGQDCSGVNNANMASSSTDGSIGRMQMYLWNPPTPDRDGTLDAEIIVHEIGHGITNRLHTLGITGTQGGQMHEGNGDLYAHVLLSEASDPINMVSTTGGYSTLNLRAGPPFNNTGNYYYGIRRFPKAVIASTGGPMNRPHNPLTYADIDPAQMATADGAFAPAFPGSATAVHDGGEIWSSMLWEMRSLMVTRLGHAAGTSKFLQTFLDGQKLAPANPTMLVERNSIIAAAQAGGTAQDVLDVREGFRRRGMGFSAANPSGNTVVEAFDAPEVGGGGPATVTSGNNLLEPNECNTLNVPVLNNSGNAATNVTATLSTTTPGITIPVATSAYPNLAAGASATNTTPFQVSLANTVACFTTANFTLTISFTGGGGGSPVTTNFSLPVGTPGNAYVFATGTGGTIPAGGVLIAGSQADDAAVTVTLPAGWNSSIYGIPVTSLSASTNGMLTANGAASTTFTNTTLLGAVGGTNPTMFPAWDDYIMTAAATTGGGIYANTVGSAPNRELYIEWRAVHFDEPDAAAISNHFAVKLTEGSNTVQYIHVLTGVAPNTQGVSATVGIQRSSAAGSPFTLAGFNASGTITPGMVRTGTLPSGVCTPGPGPCGVVPTVTKRADFDDDGRSDLSVYRPSANGTWYFQGSTSGFGAVNWGTTGDQITPGDFDGDGRTDFAVYRPVNTNNTPDVHILNSATFTYTGISWGLTGDVAVFGDYDNDDRTDVAVFRPSTNTWFKRNANDSAQIVTLGSSGDLPLTGDFNGNGNSDFALFRPSNGTWYYADPSSPGTFTAIPFGTNGDRPVHADYNGDGTDDIAVYRNGVWYIRNSGSGTVRVESFGLASDVPAPGDYDGDGNYDITVYRNGTWYVNRSNGSGVLVSAFGTTGDTPIANEYLP